MVTYTTREPRHLLMSVQKEKKLGETDQIAWQKKREKNERPL